jgi:hypothetical protein
LTSALDGSEWSASRITSPLHRGVEQQRRNLIERANTCEVYKVILKLDTTTIPLLNYRSRISISNITQKMYKIEAWKNKLQGKNTH